MTTVSQQKEPAVVHRGFRQRLHSKELSIGTFVKSTAYQTLEVLGRTSLDFAVLDAEHAPFGRESLDVCCMAAHSVDLPVLVRTARATPDAVLQALDVGADGVLIPHVDSHDVANAMVRASRYQQSQGLRGFSNSPRAGSYGQRNMVEHVTASDQGVAVIVQIESAAAVDAVETIAATDGIDGLFIGRADLAISYGTESLQHPAIQKAVQRICSAGHAQSVPVGMFLPDATEINAFRQIGVSFFVVGSDQNLLHRATMSMVQDAKS